MQKTILTILLLTSLFSVACTRDSTHMLTESLTNRLDNPLFAERYYEDLVQRMVELEIVQHPSLLDPAKKRIADMARREGLKRSREAEQHQKQGMFGTFVENEEYTTGAVLFVDNMLYFSPSFETSPGVELNIYLTTIVDPREEDVFSDQMTIEVSRLQSPYGAQGYLVSPVEDPLRYRTVVLFDKAIGRIHGFAQISPF